ncbi:hypothetical protein [Streptomyces sp. ME19-01-6]|uniref:hypothetical protein n=1 Tax=Streptomyces sp. ME19-01-6 TaxID=3028686 RepID=UPI0029B6A19E|nr:hypothetical protein [Streptomyces sp. ME19-01-6]MDX3227879.1 hypothetical protein [Streptomyces sp. ME19-01-6]
MRRHGIEIPLGRDETAVVVPHGTDPDLDPRDVPAVGDAKPWGLPDRAVPGANNSGLRLDSCAHPVTARGGRAAYDPVRRRAMEDRAPKALT